MENQMLLTLLHKQEKSYRASHPQTGEQDLRIAKAYWQGTPVPEIMEDFHYSQPTVYRIIGKVEKFLLQRQAYFNTLYRYAENNLPNYGDGEAHSILEMLFCHYEEFNRFETEAITEGFHKLYDQMEGKKLDEIDPVIYTTSILCREHEKAGFVEGVKVGVLMGVELYS